MGIDRNHERYREIAKSLGANDTVQIGVEGAAIEKVKKSFKGQIITRIDHIESYGEFPNTVEIQTQSGSIILIAAPYTADSEPFVSAEVTHFHPGTESIAKRDILAFRNNLQETALDSVTEIMIDVLKERGELSDARAAQLGYSVVRNPVNSKVLSVHNPEDVNEFTEQLRFKKIKHIDISDARRGNIVIIFHNGDELLIRTDSKNLHSIVAKTESGVQQILLHEPESMQEVSPEDIKIITHMLLIATSVHSN